MGVAETLLKENNNKVEILAKILPQMASAADARTLVAKMLDNNKTEIQKLRREIGFALKPMLGKIASLLMVVVFCAVRWVGIFREDNGLQSSPLSSAAAAGFLGPNTWHTCELHHRLCNFSPCLSDSF